MKVITAVKKYHDSDRKILIESVSNGALIEVHKDKDLTAEFGERIAAATIKKIDTEEDPDTVTIYI